MASFRNLTEGLERGRQERNGEEIMADETVSATPTPRNEGAPSAPREGGSSRPEGGSSRPEGSSPRPEGGSSRPEGSGGGGGHESRGPRPSGPRTGGPGGPGGPGGRKFFRRKKVCKFCVEKIDTIQYRDVRLLQGFVAERGKIVPRRLTGVCTTHQRRLTVAIKQARNIALLPFAARF
jgi:small subunit ribosomal protein S18